MGSKNDVFYKVRHYGPRVRIAGHIAHHAAIAFDNPLQSSQMSLETVANGPWSHT